MKRKLNTFHAQIRRASYHPRVGDFFFVRWGGLRFARVIGVSRKHVRVLCRMLNGYPAQEHVLTRQEYAKACRVTMTGEAKFKLKGRR